MNQKGTTLFVLEQTGNHIKKIHIHDGSQEILMTERETLSPTMVLIQDALYVVRSETGEIIHVNIHTGEKNIFLEGGMIRAGSLAHDDQNNLLVPEEHYNVTELKEPKEKLPLKKPLCPLCLCGEKLAREFCPGTYITKVLFHPSL